MGSLYGAYREMEREFSKGGLMRVPGEDASEDEISRYRTAIGVPDSASEYLDVLKLENGAELGEAEKPIAQMFADIAHESNTTPEAFNALVNKYFEVETAQLENMIESDSQRRSAGETELRQEYEPHDDHVSAR